MDKAVSPDDKPVCAYCGADISFMGQDGLCVAHWDALPSWIQSMFNTRRAVIASLTKDTKRFQAEAVAAQEAVNSFRDWIKRYQHGPPKELVNIIKKYDDKRFELRGDTP